MVVLYLVALLNISKSEANAFDLRLPVCKMMHSNSLLAMRRDDQVDRKNWNFDVQSFGGCALVGAYQVTFKLNGVDLQICWFTCILRFSVAFCGDCFQLRWRMLTHSVASSDLLVRFATSDLPVSPFHQLQVALVTTCRLQLVGHKHLQLADRWSPIGPA